MVTGIAVALCALSVPAAAVPPSGAPSCDVFPFDNIWHADVSSLPVHARSAQWIASTGGAAKHLHPDFGPSGDVQPYGIPFNIVAGSHAKVSVDFYYPDESDAGPYPLGSDTTIENGSDAHALMVDRDTCTLYETYDTSHDSAGWHGGSGAVWNLKSNALRPNTWTSADAAGLPIFAGLIRRDEITAGVIDHAIRMTIARSDRSYLWPARHQAGAANDATLPPMGAWFRLKQSTNITQYSAETRVVLQAMKTHGMIVADNGSDWYFGGAAENGWSSTVLDELKSITAGSFEAIDVSSLQVDPNSGQIRMGPRGTLTLSASPLTGVWGTRFALSGTLTCQGQPDANATIGVGATTTMTDATGAWTTGQIPSASTTYVARWDGDPACSGGAQSPPVRVGVRVGVALNVTNASVSRGRPAQLTGHVAPNHPGKRVNLQMLQGSTGRWVDVTHATLNGSSSYAFSYTRSSPGYLLFRVAFPTQDADHLWNVSRSVRVDWR